MKIVLAKRFCLTVIGLMTIMTILSQPKPDITITQALKLDHFANPFEEVIGRTTTLINFDKKKPTGRVLIIEETDGELSLTLTWEFD